MGSLQMEKDRNNALEGSQATANQSAPDAAFLDTKGQFEVWLDTLNQNADSTTSKLTGVAEQAADFFVECGEGTNCQIAFTGLLDLSGVLSGSLRSESGSLVTRSHARIDANIE